LKENKKIKRKEKTRKEKTRKEKKRRKKTSGTMHEKSLLNSQDWHLSPYVIIDVDKYIYCWVHRYCIIQTQV
jgi:hypothetical protein